MTVVHASEFIDPQRLIVESAELLAREVIVRLSAGENVQISLDGVRGTPSSYYNVLLMKLIEKFGSSVTDRVQFQFAREAQRQVYERSLAAVKKSVA